jgi:hypothetical protein
MSDDAPEPTPAGPLSGSKSSRSKSFDPELETPEYAATTKDVTVAADALAVYYGKAVRASAPALIVLRVGLLAHGHELS